MLFGQGVLYGLGDGSSAAIPIWHWACHGRLLSGLSIRVSNAFDDWLERLPLGNAFKLRIPVGASDQRHAGYSSLGGQRLYPRALE